VIIYKATNTKNGKVYIGQTIQSLNQRKIDHQRKAELYGSTSYFHAAIRKYGFSAFSWEIIDRAESDTELNQKEKLWISELNSNQKTHGYNLTTGGDSAKLNDESRKKLSEAITGSKNPNFGKVKSIETRLKMSLSQKGKKQPREAVEKMRRSLTGKKHPPEVVEKRRQKMLGKKWSAESIEKTRQANLGSKRSEESKRKMSAARKGRFLGELCPTSKITSDIARGIKIDLKSGMRPCDIERKYSVTKSIVYGIKNGTTWRHIDAT
jgi:group I intron endonuclease